MTNTDIERLIECLKKDGYTEAKILQIILYIATGKTDR